MKKMYLFNAWQMVRRKKGAGKAKKTYITFPKLEISGGVYETMTALRLLMWWTNSISVLVNGGDDFSLTTMVETELEDNEDVPKAIDSELSH